MLLLEPLQHHRSLHIFFGRWIDRLAAPPIAIASAEGALPRFSSVHLGEDDVEDGGIVEVPRRIGGVDLGIGRFVEEEAIGVPEADLEPIGLNGAEELMGVDVLRGVNVDVDL